MTRYIAYKNEQDKTVCTLQYKQCPTYSLQLYLFSACSFLLPLFHFICFRDRDDKINVVN